MRELETFSMACSPIIYSESEDEHENNSDINDWDIIRKIKKGKCKVNNDIILLKNLELEQHIYNMTLNFYNQAIESLNSPRIKYKNAIMCACLFMAFSINGYPREEQTLFDYFKVDKNKYIKGLKFVKSCVKETRYVQKTFDNILFSICRTLSILDEMEQIKLFIKTNLNLALKYTTRTSYKSMNCAIIYIWLLKTKTIIPDVKTYANICNISHKTISRLIYKNKDLYKDFFYNQIQEKLNPFLQILIQQINHINLVNKTSKIYNLNPSNFKIDCDFMSDNIISDLFKC